MLGEIISIIVGPFSPKNDELALSNTIPEPVRAHVNGLGAALFDGGIGEPRGNFVVSLDGGSRLWVAHVGEGCPEHTGILGSVEAGSEFRFGGRGEDHGHNGAEDVDGAIAWWQGQIWAGCRVVRGEGLGEVEVTACTGPGGGFGQIRRIAVNS